MTIITLIHIAVIIIGLFIIVLVLLSKEKDDTDQIGSNKLGQEQIDKEIKHLTNKRRPIKYAEGTASVDFFNDLESPDIDRRRVGSHFWIACHRMCLTLYKNNWGSEIDYKFREDGFIETIHSIPEDEMPKLMKLCNNAKSEKAIVRYLYDRFSQDGYASYNNMLVWLKENNIEYSTYWNV